MDDIKDSLMGLTGEKRVEVSAQMIEDIAYELAGHVEPNQVSALLLVAAQLQRRVTEENAAMSMRKVIAG